MGYANKTHITKKDKKKNGYKNWTELRKNPGTE